VQPGTRGARGTAASLSSAAFVAVLGIAVLVSYNEDAYAGVERPVDQRVREAIKRKPAPAIARRRPQARAFNYEFGNAFKLIEEAGSHGATAFSTIETCGF
jgi:hypothetical protein